MIYLTFITFGSNISDTKQQNDRYKTEKPEASKKYYCLCIKKKQ